MDHRLRRAAPLAALAVMACAEGPAAGASPSTPAATVEPRALPLSGSWRVVDAATGAACAIPARVGLDGRTVSALDPACAAAFPEAAGLVRIEAVAEGVAWFDAAGRRLATFRPAGRAGYEAEPGGRRLRLVPQ